MPLTAPLAKVHSDPRVHIVVSCSNTKRQPPAPGMRVRDLPPVSMKGRATEWVSRLTSSDTERITANRLYAGEHWSIAMMLPEIGGRQGFQAVLWVLSAGYGLMPADHAIVPYAATFSSGSPDCVGTGSEALIWWANLVAAKKIDTGKPRTLAALAASDPGSHIMVAAALPYLLPIAQDTLSAANRLHSDDQLMVVSAGARDSANGLTPFLVPFDSRLIHTIGGSRVALNVRTLRFILESVHRTNLGRQAASRYLVEHLNELPPIPSYARTPLTDEEVVNYIAERLLSDPGLSATRMLRDLRDRGKACEQQRFHQLVREVKASQ